MTLSSSAAQKKVLVIAFILLALDQFTKFWAVLTLENRPRISLIPALIGEGGPWVSLTVTSETRELLLVLVRISPSFLVR